METRYLFTVPSDMYCHCTEMYGGGPSPTINLGDFSGNMVTIVSPNYGNGVYPDHSDCHWSFETENPANRIRIVKVEWEVGAVS